jgi:Lrp/AsnC family leucine-responsive transcriptional regulator
MGSSVVLLGDQLPVPSQQGLRRDNAGGLGKNLSSQRFGLYGQSPALIVIEAHSPVTELFAKHPILLAKIFNDLQLAVVHPPRDGDQQRLEWVEHSLRIQNSLSRPRTRRAKYRIFMQIQFSDDTGLCPDECAFRATRANLGAYPITFMPKTKLDEFDLKILEALQSDGRLTNVELAERISLSPSPCLRRVRRLEAEGVIERYSATVNRAKLGLGLTVFVEVKLARHAARDAERFGELIRSMPEVIACHLVSGDADFLLEIVLSDLEQYSRVVLKSLRNIEGIQSVHSRFVLETVKAHAHLPLPPIDVEDADYS